MRIHGYIAVLSLAFYIPCKTTAPAEVMPLLQTLSAHADVTVIDRTPLGQSLAAEQAQIKKYVPVGAHGYLIARYATVHQMLGVITAYVDEQTAWLPTSFVAAWRRLLQVPFALVPVHRSARGQDLATAIHEVVESVSSATTAVVKAVTACMRLLRQLKACIGMPQTRSITTSEQQLHRASRGHAVRALLITVGVLTAGAISIALWHHRTQTTFSSRQHRDIVPTTGVDTVGRPVRRDNTTNNAFVAPPALPVRPATPNQTQLPRCLQPLLTLHGRRFALVAGAHQNVRALCDNDVVSRVVTSPDLLTQWFANLFARKNIAVAAGTINHKFKNLVAALFFRKRGTVRHHGDSLFTQQLVARCAWALRQLVATGTPTSTCSRPVVTLREPEHRPYVIQQYDEQLLAAWNAQCGTEPDAFHEAFLWATSRQVQAVRQQVGAEPSDQQLSVRLAHEMVAQFIAATAQRMGSDNLVAAERLIAEHLFYGLTRYERCWQNIIQADL